MTKRILIVEDEAAIRELVCACLEDLGGWEVLAAASGCEGLLQVQTKLLDAILLDVLMPEIDGFVFHEQVKGNPTTETIPIILLTAKVLPNEQAQFAQMDIAGVITKPFDPTQICEQVAEILQWS